MNKHLTAVALGTLVTLAAGVALAQTNAGQVTKIDKAQQKITVKHEGIKALDMPPMSMAFRVKDATMLDAVKEGDAVHFDAEKVGGQYIITRIGR